jgi:hypothetical protein
MANSIHPKRKKTTQLRKNKGPWKASAQKERRKSAEERQAKRDKLTAQQQFAALDKAGFTATRERARLLAKLNEKENEQKRTGNETGKSEKPKAQAHKGKGGVTTRNHEENRQS